MRKDKQSSVEWLFDELARINFEYATNKITPRDFQEQKEKIKQQAKSMHKEEIEDAYEQGEQDGYWHPEDGWIKEFANSQYYYNGTFNNKEA